MKKKRAWSARAIVLMIFAGALSGVLLAQISRPKPMSKIKVTGEVSLIMASNGSWVISPWFSVLRGGNPVSGLNVRLQGFYLKETMPGQYAGIRITAITPVAGNTLKFSIASRPAISPLLIDKISFGGSAVIDSLAQITQPVSGSSLSVAALSKAIVVSWIGGMPPFTLALLKTTSGSVLEIFNKKGLPGPSSSLSATLFLAGNTYDIAISYNMNPFVLKVSDPGASLLLDPSSDVTLHCTVFSSVAVN